MIDFISLILYLFIAFISTAFFSACKSKNQWMRYIGISLSILIPSIFAGIRYNVGTDYQNYWWTFEQLDHVSFEWILTDSSHFNMDRGFLIVSKIFRLGFNSKCVFAIWGAIILTIFVLTIYNQYREYDITLMYLTFVLMYYYSSFNILRQILALVIVFYSLKYVRSNQLIKYLILVLIATTFHFSALLVLPIWFLWDHKLNKSINLVKKWMICLAAIIAVGMWQSILKLLANFNISAILKYTGYFEKNNHMNMSFLIKVVLTLFFIILQTRFQKKDDKLVFLTSLFILGTIIEYTGYYSSFVKRCSIYYAVSEIVLFSEVPLFFTKYSKQLCRFLVVLFIVLYFALSSFVLKQGELIPFRIF